MSSTISNSKIERGWSFNRDGWILSMSRDGHSRTYHGRDLLIDHNVVYVDRRRIGTLADFPHGWKADIPYSQDLSYALVIVLVVIVLLLWWWC
jgi:hypothetical protein